MPKHAPNTDISIRSAVITLRTIARLPTKEIAAILNLDPRTVQRIYAKACERGFDPTCRPFALRDHHITDKRRPGRPPKASQEVVSSLEKKIDTFDGRNMSSADLAAFISSSLNITISASTIQRTLKKLGYSKCKPTMKPGLTPEMKAARYQFALEHKDWTLEDWKKVIWTDETSVLLNYWKGSFRIWRKKEEKYFKTCTRRRFKGASQFMFWGAFSYDKKGPCYVWPKETAKEKKENDKALEALNKELEPVIRAEWELNKPMERLGLRTKRGRKPQWRWNKKNGKLVRDSKGGIDWYRYQKHILHPLLFPFAQECQKERPDTLVMEDNAPPHAHHFNRRLYDLNHVCRLLWPGNSPDLNPIEPVWGFMKKFGRQNYVFRTHAEAHRAWVRMWNEDVSQRRLQEFVERIPEHIAQIIRLKGGNEYKEGRAKGENNE